jgi:hypothetical protein
LGFRNREGCQNIAGEDFFPQRNPLRFAASIGSIQRSLRCGF